MFDSSMRTQGKVSDDVLQQIAHYRKTANINEIESASEFQRLLDLGYSEEQAIDLMSKMSSSAEEAPIIIKPGVSRETTGLYHPDTHSVDFYNNGFGNVEDLAGTIDHEWGGHAATRGIINKAEAQQYKDVVPYAEDFAELLTRNQNLFNNNSYTEELIKISNALADGNQELAIKLAKEHFGDAQIKSIDDVIEAVQYAVNPQETRARMWQTRMKEKLTGQSFESQYNDPYLDSQDMGWLKRTYNFSDLLNYYKKFGAVSAPIIGGSAFLKLNDTHEKERY